MRNYNLRCIDGSIHGCGKCVGYCMYQGHPGFLTEELQKEHHCLEKGCFYHQSKPATQKKKKPDTRIAAAQILSLAQASTAGMDGLRVLRAEPVQNSSWVVYYAAIARYDVARVEEELTAGTEHSIRMKQIPCDFEIAARLVLS